MTDVDIEKGSFSLNDVQVEWSREATPSGRGPLSEFKILFIPGSAACRRLGLAISAWIEEERKLAAQAAKTQGLGHA